MQETECVLEPLFNLVVSLFEPNLLITSTGLVKDTCLIGKKGTTIFA